MKTPLLIIINWLISLSLMATNSIVQGIIALVWFGISSYYLHKNMRAVMITVYLFEKRMLHLLKLD